MILVSLCKMIVLKRNLWPILFNYYLAKWQLWSINWFLSFIELQMTYFSIFVSTLKKSWHYFILFQSNLIISANHEKYFIGNVHLIFKYTQSRKRKKLNSAGPMASVPDTLIIGNRGPRSFKADTVDIVWNE